MADEISPLKESLLSLIGIVLLFFLQYEMSYLDTSRTIVLPGAGSRLTIMLLAVDVISGVVGLLSTNAVLFVLGSRAHLYGLLKHGNLNGGDRRSDVFGGTLKWRKVRTKLVFNPSL
jgi:hypothetical protein